MSKTVQNRIAKYAKEHPLYVTYLRKLKELKGFCPDELKPAYTALVEGKRAFKEEYAAVLDAHLQVYTMDELLSDLEAEIVKRTERKLAAEQWTAARSEAAEKRSNERRDQQYNLIQALLQIIPENKSLKVMRTQLEDGKDLIPAQVSILEHLQKTVEYAMPSATNLSADLAEQMREFLRITPNSFLQKMLNLVEHDVKLTQTQIIKIRDILDSVAKFDEDYASERMLLERLNREDLTEDQRRRFKYISTTFKKARNFGKFFDQTTETNFKKDLAKLVDDVMVTA